MRGLLLLLLVLTAAGCKKPATKATTTPATQSPVTGTVEAAPPNTNYDANAAAAQNLRNAAMRTILLTQMTNLGLTIELEFTQNGKMPQLNAVTAALDAATNAAIKEGRIVLCWTAEHQGLWAYEGGADTKGGVVLVTGAARRAEADEVKKLLGR